MNSNYVLPRECFKLVNVSTLPENHYKKFLYKNLFCLKEYLISQQLFDAEDMIKHDK